MSAAGRQPGSASEVGAAKTQPQDRGREGGRRSPQLLPAPQPGIGGRVTWSPRVVL